MTDLAATGVVTAPDASMLRVLVAAGDHLALDHTVNTLELNGFRVLRAEDGVVAVKRWLEESPDVVLVDVMLPPRDGFDVCRRIREISRTPVIMVANDAVESDVVMGFTSGADDFVVRPYGTTQLGWRIRAVYGRYTTAPSRLRAPTQLKLGDVTLDLEAHQIAYRETRVFLTPIEFRIFSALAADEGEIVSFSQLIEAAWPNQSGRKATVESLKSHVTRLRTKLRDLGGQAHDILFIAKSGYTLSRSPKPLDNAK